MKHDELAIGLSEELYVDVGVMSSVIDEYFCRKIDHEQLKGKLSELILTSHNVTASEAKAQNTELFSRLVGNSPMLH